MHQRLYFLKNTITYILILLVSFAYSYETIVYMAKSIDNNLVVWVDDVQCDDNELDSKKKETDEKKNFKEYLSLPLDIAFITHNGCTNNIFTPNHYLNCDYSLAVYSPPELSI